MTALKPPVRYFGAKGSIAEQIVALMPPHQGYVEPFGGSLAVLLAKAPTKIEVVNDLDEKLMTFWRVLRDRPDELARICDLTPHSRGELDRAQVLDATNELELARQVWVMLTQGRSGTLKRTGWRHFADPSARGSGFGIYMDAYRRRLTPAAERLRDVTLECRPALELIAKYGRHETNLLYVDPPYVHSTRRGARYSHELSTDEHHELSTALHDCKATVLLSGYASDLYDELYPDWHQTHIAAQSDNALVRDVIEVIWSNRPLGDYLWHDDEALR